MPQSYPIPEHSATAEQTVKRSVFICSIFRAEDRQEAMQQINKIKEQHREANHNCWAFIAGPPQDHSCWGMNDDGEPKGCAGRPMFNILQHSGIGKIGCVVTRYFGGIKLGTGGMARAYSSTVSLAIAKLSTILHQIYEQASLTVEYANLADVLHLLQESQVQVLAQEYSDKVSLTLNIPAGTSTVVSQRLTGLTNGKLSLSEDPQPS